MHEAETKTCNKLRLLIFDSFTNDVCIMKNTFVINKYLFIYLFIFNKLAELFISSMLLSCMIFLSCLGTGIAASSMFLVQQFYRRGKSREYIFIVSCRIS